MCNYNLNGYQPRELESRKHKTQQCKSVAVVDMDQNIITLNLNTLNFDSKQMYQKMQGPPHKCAVIFVDNSGIDIVLGVLPFVRELLIRRTKVLLCANTEPSLNDVTSKELEQILDRCQCNILQNARNNNQLLVYATGQSTPCLDLRTLSPGNCDYL